MSDPPQIPNGRPDREDDQALDSLRVRAQDQQATLAATIAELDRLRESIRQHHEWCAAFPGRRAHFV